jgi:hypothetical protein
MSQHGRDNNNNMKRHSPEPIALGSGLFFVCDFLSLFENIIARYWCKFSFLAFYAYTDRGCVKFILVVWCLFYGGLSMESKSKHI